VNTLLADPSVLATPEQPPTTETPPPGFAPESPSSAAAAPQRACANCGAALDRSQDWCLHCGAGAPGSLDTGGPSWRSAATVLAATGILVLGAGAAAYAALSKEGPHKPRPVTVAVASTPAPVTPAATTPGTPTPPPPGAVTPTPKASGTPAVNPLFTGTAKPPKIPLTTPTPKSSGTATTPSSPTNESSGTTTPSTSTKSSGGTNSEHLPAAIVLDTNAAITYNPYGYPASEFGDPSLAIDGDTSTAWTAQVNPAVAPKMAEGLVIDLKTATRLSAVALITSTPGMSVQVYGANGHTLPASITDPAWVQLSPFLVEPKRKVHIKLRDATKAFRFVTLWISKAPAFVGTAPDRVPPTHVSVNELELFPAAG
jgi:hypothetical protein